MPNKKSDGTWGKGGGLKGRKEGREEGLKTGIVEYVMHMVESIFIKSITVYTECRPAKHILNKLI